MKLRVHYILVATTGELASPVLGMCRESSVGGYGEFISMEQKRFLTYHPYSSQG